MSRVPLNADFVDLLREFTEAEVEFVVVGAHALGVHGVVRATGDLDVLVHATPANAVKVVAALRAFGAPLTAHGVANVDFATEGVVYQMGLPPRRIDVLTRISGPDFATIWLNRKEADFGGMLVPVIGREEFVANKRAAGRAKDLLDIALLSECDAEGMPEADGPRR